MSLLVSLILATLRRVVPTLLAQAIKTGVPDLVKHVKAKCPAKRAAK